MMEMLGYCLHLTVPFPPRRRGWRDGPTGVKCTASWYWNDFASMCAVIERATGAPIGDAAHSSATALYKLMQSAVVEEVALWRWPGDTAADREAMF